MSHRQPLSFQMSLLVSLLLLFFMQTSCRSGSGTDYSKHIDTTVKVYAPYHVVKLPVSKGVRIRNPIQLAKGPGGRLYACNQSGEVYYLEDTDGDGIEDAATLYCDINQFKLNSPAGFTFRGDTVFVGTRQEIRAFVDMDKDGKADTSWTFFNQIPHSGHPYEWTSGLSFDSEGWLYCVLTTDSWNAAPSPDPQKLRGSIIRISPDGKQFDRVATGIRSVHGLTINAAGEVIFLDNAGGGNPKEELNLLERNGFYGHNGKKFNEYDNIVKPALELQSELAPAGIICQGDRKGDSGGDRLFIAFYGPGERWNKGAVARVDMSRRRDGTYAFTETVIADMPKLSAIAAGENGDLYLAHHGVADYWYNSVEEVSGGFYKLVYDDKAVFRNIETRKADQAQFAAGSLETGRQLFAERACSACHGTGNGAELLGPDLAGIGNTHSRQEIMEDILQPSKIIKPSMGATRVTRKSGQVMLGRVIHSDDAGISLMLVGNSVVNIPRSDIQKTEAVKQSLMYEGLLSGLSDAEINSLLDYIVSLK